MQKYNVSIKLEISGPFLTAASSTETYGLDKAFNRNYANQPEIPGSHIKGKLRMALGELKPFCESEPLFDLETLFGQPSASGTYISSAGQIHFSPFVCSTTPVEQHRVRTAVNFKTMTAAENQLREFENPFPSGSSTIWQGSVSFYANDIKAAQQIVNIIRLGFNWLTAMGAEKGVGSGVLQKVWVTQPNSLDDGPSIDLGKFSSSQSVHLRIQPVEYLMIGGIKKPRANFVRSERIITGGVIKGALATSLNLAHGIKPNVALSAETGQHMPGFELLAEYFDQIRVTHAFPSIDSDQRPVKIPLTTVMVNEHYYDMALVEDPDLLVEEQAPVYSIDWKIPRIYFEEASPKEVFVTRTSIDNTTRRANEGQLFTYTYLCPVDSDNHPVYWLCNVDFSAIEDANTQTSVRDQFVRAVSMHLDRLGKLNHPVKVEILPDQVSPAMESQNLIHDGFVVITLQTDALMLNPQDVANLAPGKDLKNLYSEYWQHLCQQEGQPACMELENFFAQQNFQGGYLYHRYVGDGKNQSTADYYPYYLTAAGSVFILRIHQVEAAQACLSRWLERGLSLPAWAIQKYSQDGRAIWQTCPFMPANGFGEIIVNLKWHWDKYAGSSHTENQLSGGEA